jgi:hypothetical protein
LIDRKDDSYEKRFVPDAVINLYAAHVHSLLYSYNHPLISDALKNAFQGLQKALRRKPVICLDISGGRLTVDGEPLDGDVLVLGHFASWLSSRNIETLSFEVGLTRRELIAFHNIISTKKQTIAELLKTMSEKSIFNIKVQPAKPSGDHEIAASPNCGTPKGLITEYESTMYHMESRQAKSPFFTRPDSTSPLEDAAHYGQITDYDDKIYQPEGPGLVPFSDSPGKRENDPPMAMGERYAECVEALLEHDISGEEHDIIKEIPPQEMAHLLNTMFFSAPREELVDKITKTYFETPEEMRGEDAAERCRIFIAGLRPILRSPFLLRCASLFDTETLFKNNETDVLHEAVQKPNTPSGTVIDADMTQKQTAFVPGRIIEGSDFSFDSVVCGHAVVHDIEMSKEAAGMFNEEHLAQYNNERASDILSFCLRTAEGAPEIQTSVIEECTEEAINEAYFCVLLQMLESTSLNEDAYQKLEGRIAALVKLFSEEGEFENLLDLLNSLKTQSLQGKWRVDAAVMMRRLFSSDTINSKVVGALRQYGRKQRENAYKLTNAIRSFIIPYLLDALSKESDTGTRRFIISLVISVRSDAVDHIVRRLNDSSWYITRNMLYLLRECRGINYTSAVRGFLEHEVPLVRLEALRTLLNFQDPNADAYVTKFLRGDMFQLKEGAVRLAGAYRMKHAVPHLIKLLREKGITKKSNFKRVIVRALGRIGDSRAVNELLNICTSSSGLRRDEHDKLQVEIFRTLRNYPVATIRPLIDYGMRSANKEILAITEKLHKGLEPPTGEIGKTT